MPDFEQPAEDIAHVVLLVDESGSMMRSREATVSSINEYVDGLRGKIPDSSTVTLLKFTTTNNSELKLSLVFDKTPLGDVRALTLDDYRPDASTPLLDALGRTIEKVDELLKEREGAVFFAVITDGQENASKSFRLEKIRGMIDERTSAGWTFSFIGVGIEAYGDASALGFSVTNTVSVSRATFADSVKMMSAVAETKFGLYAQDKATYALRSAAVPTWTVEQKKTVETD